jgi:hypothetical protein
VRFVIGEEDEPSLSAGLDGTGREGGSGNVEAEGGGRDVVGGAIDNFEPLIGLVFWQIIEAEMLIVLPHFLVLAFHKLVSSSLLLSPPLLGLPLLTDHLQVYFLGFVQNALDLFVVLSGDASLLGVC